MYWEQLEKPDTNKYRPLLTVYEAIPTKSQTKVRELLMDSWVTIVFYISAAFLLKKEESFEPTAHVYTQTFSVRQVTS